MKKYIVALAALAATQAFAVENCIDFPVMNETEVAFRGEISEVSDMTSFAGCPDSVLVNTDVVARLIKLQDYNDEKRCVYSNNRMLFMCQK